MNQAENRKKNGTKLLEDVTTQQTTTAFVNSYKTATNSKAPSRLTRFCLDKKFFLWYDKIIDFGAGRFQKDRKHIEAVGPEYVPYEPTVTAKGRVLYKNKPEPAECVIMSNVLCVIPTREERVRAIVEAYSMALKDLIISVPIGYKPNGTPLNDGVITSIGTFQRTWEPGDLWTFLDEVQQAKWPWSARTKRLDYGIVAILKD